jgi:sulfite reductase (NADPH) hemoprotein beta-component
MAAPKRPPLPVILIANDLLDGDVVFRTADGWTRDPAEARIARDDAAATALEAEAAAEVARCKVIDAYLIDVQVAPGGRPVPNHYRERIKTLGPSNRRDLGKQAELAGK